MTGWQFCGGRGRFVVAAAVVLTLGGFGMLIAAATHGQPPGNAVLTCGIGELGMTKAFFRGGTTNLSYTKGVLLRRAHVGSTASSRCEAGARYRKPP